ncbi:MAG: hypothetical protein IPP22_15010 [Nitrosomonas sp.]|nr:hypothetical protein [Nitrosomonas sp.]
MATADCCTADIDSISSELRSVGLEHMAYAACAVFAAGCSKLTALGIESCGNGLAIGDRCRMVAPGSELSTHRWLQREINVGDHRLRFQPM